VDVFKFSREVNDKSGQTVLDRLPQSRCLLLLALRSMNRGRCSSTSFLILKPSTASFFCLIFREQFNVLLSVLCNQLCLDYPVTMVRKAVDGFGDKSALSETDSCFGRDIDGKGGR
jgi:hypothetical protein